MQDLVIMKNHQAVTSSLQVADTFDKEHRAVLKAIDDLKEGLAQNYADLFWEDEYIHPQNKQKYRIIYMNRDGFTLAALGFNNTKKVLDFKLKYIEAFNEMEKIIKQSTVPQTIEDMMIHQLEEMKDVKKDVSKLKDTMRITGQQEAENKDHSARKVVECLGGKDSPAYKQHSKKVFSSYWRDFKQYFHLPRYGELPRVKFDEALSFIDEWLPNTEVRLLIKNTNKQGDIFE